MFIFIVTISVLILLALLFVVPALFRAHSIPAENFDQQNIRIARERLQELKREFAAGAMSQEIFDQARLELEQALALDLSAGDAAPAQSSARSARVLGLILLVSLPVAAVLLYLQLGRIDSLGSDFAEMPGPIQPGMNMSMDEAIEKLKAKLEQDPSSPQGWYMLARSYMAMQRYAESAGAFRKALELAGDDPDLLLQYADALVMSQGGRFAGEPAGLISKALEISPRHPQGLWLAGMAANEAGDYRQALRHWYKLELLLEGDIESQTEVRTMIAGAEQQLSPQQVKQLRGEMPAVSAAGITVRVEVADSVRSGISPSDTVFVVARAMDGPPMPLAVARYTAAELPLTVRLDDAMAMAPAMKLSGFQQVKIMAMVSRAGTAQLVAGDLYGEVLSVKVGPDTSVKLSIDRVK
ncbi:MAG: cytochrome c-type biosis protein CcmH [Pseudomonadota bacterium]|nr:cytochrome c-type biosis protein CcmH [Pseudomonadota bacterium]